MWQYTNKVGLAGLLQSENGGGLKTQIVLKVLCDFANQSLEGQLANE
jgi:hypothetical protein